METMKVDIEGKILMMHNIRLANPLDEGTKRMKALTSVRKKTDDIHIQMADLEFELGMYYNEKEGPYIPGIWVDAAIIAGGKLQKNGSRIKRAAMVLDDIIPLRYDGPRKMVDLKADLNFRDIRAVTVGTAKTMRCRPKFVDWGAFFTVQYDPDQITKGELEQAIHAAGQCIGIGDFRPRFGRFSATING